MTYFNAFYGMDVHQDSTTIARVLPDQSETVLTTIPTNRKDLCIFFVKELENFQVIASCYEAGGCGYFVHRILGELGVHNQIIAPSLIPQIGRNKVKHDKIYAKKLAIFLKNGQLVPIYVPTKEVEAMREKTRQRHLIRNRLTKSKVQLSGFLRRFGQRYDQTRTKWTKTFWNWLNRINFSDSTLQMVFIDYLEEIERLQKLKERIEGQIMEMNQRWSKKPIVDAISTLKGVGVFGAICIVAEVGSFSRFKRASQFMGYLGLTPSEYSSGTKTTRGRITKMGNSHVRFLLIEGAQLYRRSLNKTAQIRTAWKEKPEEYVEHAWKAQKRLYSRYWKFLDEGKHPHIAMVAIARELAGFVWALGCNAERQLVPIRTA